MAAPLPAHWRLPKQLCARGRGPGQGKAPADAASWYVTPDIQLVPEGTGFLNPLFLPHQIFEMLSRIKPVWSWRRAQ